MSYEKYEAWPDDQRFFSKFTFELRTNFQQVLVIILPI